MDDIIDPISQFLISRFNKSSQNSLSERETLVFSQLLKQENFHIVSNLILSAIYQDFLQTPESKFTNYEVDDSFSSSCPYIIFESSKFQSLKENIENLQKENSDLNSSLLSLKKEHQHQIDQISTKYQTEILNFESRNASFISEVKQRNKTLEFQNSSQQSELANLEQTNKTIQTKAQKELDHLKDTNASIQKENQGLKKKNFDLQTAISVLQTDQETKLAKFSERT